MTSPTPPRQKCTARRTNGEPCRAWAVQGLKVCIKHGGASKKARAAGARRMRDRQVEEAAERARMTLGVQRTDLTPSAALLEEVQWTAGHVAWLRGMVQDLEERAAGVRIDDDGATDIPGPHPLIYGTTRQEYEPTVRVIRDDDGSIMTTAQDGPMAPSKRVDTAAVSLWYDLYMREREHLVKVSAAALNAGVEERRVALAEQQGAQVAAVLRTVLESMFARLIHRSDAPPTRDQWDQAIGDIVPGALRQLVAR